MPSGMQLGQRMLREEVTAADVAEVAAKWTGIPVTQLLAPERAKLLALPQALHQRVVGQDVAVDAVADALQRSAPISHAISFQLPSLRRCNSGCVARTLLPMPFLHYKGQIAYQYRILICNISLVTQCSLASVGITVCIDRNTAVVGSTHTMFRLAPISARSHHG